MKIARSPLMLTLALTLAFGTLSVRSAGAHEGHDHEAMKKQEKKIDEALSALPSADQKLATAQRFCPIMTYDRLGSMGTPIKLTIEGKPVFVCCKACKEDAVKGGEKTLKTVAKLRDATETLAELPMNERVAIEAQKYCAVANTSFLGSMGKPIKLEIDGKPVYLCCDGCSKKAKADPAGTLAKAEELMKDETLENHDHNHAAHKH